MTAIKKYQEVIKLRDDQIRKMVIEEVTDAFIYTVILANLLGVDLKEEYFKKQKINAKKYSQKL